VFVGTQRGIGSPPGARGRVSTRHDSLRGPQGYWRDEILSGTSRSSPPRLWDSFAILRRTSFAAALGVGGYGGRADDALLPCCADCPTVVFEPNAEPGFTNRVLAGMVTRVATAYEGPTKLWGRKATLTGIPVRPDFFRHPSACTGRTVPYSDYRRQPGRTCH